MPLGVHDFRPKHSQLSKSGRLRSSTKKHLVDFATTPESAKLTQTDANEAVMSLRKLCLYAMLATVLAFAAAGRLNHYTEKSDVLETGVPEKTRPSASTLTANFPVESQATPTGFLAVQFKNSKSLRAGQVLVASRNLGDPHFAKTVILLVHYDAQGVLGLVLNHRTDVPLSRVLDSFKAAKDRSDPVYLGGPLETAAVFALLQSPAKAEGAEHIFGGVYLINSKPLFEQTISAQPKPDVFHVYLGYAGWTQGQLQQEVELGAWFIFPPEAGTVFNADPDVLWPEMIRKTELQYAEMNWSRAYYARD
jgi:putative transcriptional regulator